MGGKSAIALGLVSGLAAGALLVGGVIALAPGPAAPAISAPPVPTAPPGTPTESAPATPSASPTGTPSVAPSATPTDGVAPAFRIGEPAPSLRLPLLGGGSVDLADYAGSPVWVSFMATSCALCVDEIPSMADFLVRYEQTGLVVLVVDVREDEATVEAFFDDLGTSFPTGLDTDGTAQAAWGAQALPVHYWVDAAGILRDGALGGIGPDVMAQGLQTILPGAVVTP